MLSSGQRKSRPVCRGADFGFRGLADGRQGGESGGMHGAGGEYDDSSREAARGWRGLGGEGFGERDVGQEDQGRMEGSFPGYSR